MISKTISLYVFCPKKGLYTIQYNKISLIPFNALFSHKKSLKNIRMIKFKFLFRKENILQKHKHKVLILFIIFLVSFS